MGTFHHPLDIGDPTGSRFETVEALVDTGATYTVVPESVLRHLGVEPIEGRTFVLGDGSRIQRDVGQTWTRVDGRSIIRIVVFGDERAGAVLGADTLEGLGLAVDPVRKRLVPAEALLMRLA